MVVVVVVVVVVEVFDARALGQSYIATIGQLELRA
jgi:hypothetical protein